VRERDVVERLLRIEQRSVQIYEELARSGGLRGRAAEAADLFLAHERRHVDALKQALAAMKAPVPGVAPGRAGVGGTAREMIRTALDHELTCIRAYQSAQGSLKAPALLGSAAGVMANEAQHLAVLRQLLGEQPAPVAFVTGR
jgi:rubrerythrin